jgi:hypothetical protein
LVGSKWSDKWTSRVYAVCLALNKIFLQAIEKYAAARDLVKPGEDFGPRHNLKMQSKEPVNHEEARRITKASVLGFTLCTFVAWVGKDFAKLSYYRTFWCDRLDPVA